MMTTNNASPLANNNRNVYQSVRIRNKLTSISVSLFRYVFLISFSYILLYPIIYILTHSFRDPADFSDPTVMWIPKSFSWEPLMEAIDKLNFPTSLVSTLLVEVVSALISIVTCGVAAYGMARFNFKGRGILNFVLILTILVPASMVIIPNYVTYYKFDVLGIGSLINLISGVDLRPNLLGTLWTFYLPAITSVGIRAGFYIYIYMQFYKSLPKELEEAAWVDGAGPWGTYLRIVVPSSGSAVLSVSLLAIVWYWNDYYNAMMYFNKDLTMAVELNSFFQKMLAEGSRTLTSDAPITSCLLFILPLLIMYMFLQKKFIASIASTGIVG